VFVLDSVNKKSPSGKKPGRDQLHSSPAGTGLPATSVTEPANVTFTSTSSGGRESGLTVTVVPSAERDTSAAMTSAPPNIRMEFDETVVGSSGSEKTAWTT